MNEQAIALTKGCHPLTGESRSVERPRRDLHALKPVRHQMRASYDAARDSDEFRNYWANADALDADAANSKTVRSKLVQRSRYETANNGFTDGMVQTYATDLIGVGPSLRMQSASTAFNRFTEIGWWKWGKAIQFRRKLWCMAHAKVQDGEPFAIIRNNPKVAHQVKLDMVLVETEQCQTPFLPYDEVNYIDGIKFDEFGNPEWYDILKHHPGGAFSARMTEPEKVPARFVLHWFMLRRPGQHRGVPEFRSTLNVGASSRRMREATVGAVETAASLGAALLKTTHAPEEIDAVAPMSTLDIQKRMMTALPMGWDATQMKAEHPNATYDSFLRSQISEQGRPKSMPYNKAACDSSSYNYASGRLDHQTYYAGLDVEREDCNDLVLDPLVAVWFREFVLAILTAAPGDVPDEIRLEAEQFFASRETPDHTWDWPKHPVADIKAEAAANDTKLRNGSTTLRRVWSEQGLDYDDEVAQMAQDYGVSVDEMKAILRNTLFPDGQPQAKPANKSPLQQQIEEEEVANAP